jgi:broad specificity phosphatase PhoE
MYCKIIDSFLNLYVLRHAEPIKHGGFVSDKYAELTEVGKEQAYQTGITFVKHGVVPKEIVYSPFIRTQETADFLIKGIKSEEHSADILLSDSPLLREMDLGSYPSLLDIGSAFPVFNKLLKLFFSPKISEHEDIQKTRARIMDNKAELLNHSGTVIFVSHVVFNELLSANLTEKRWNPLNFYKPFLYKTHFVYSYECQRWLIVKDNW